MKFSSSIIPAITITATVAVTEVNGMNIPDSWYQQCVDKTNAMRSREGLPALHRWYEAETCADASAEYDQLHGIPHGSLSAGFECTKVGTLYAQNSCPNWQGGPDQGGNVAEGCISDMWTNEKDGDSMQVLVDGTCSDKLSGDYVGGWFRCGHYFNIRGKPNFETAVWPPTSEFDTDRNYEYNFYTHVTCGFAFNGHSWYVNQIFKRIVESGQQQPVFECGGDETNQPGGFHSPTSRVDDCQFDFSAQYNNCAVNPYEASGCLGTANGNPPLTGGGSNNDDNNNNDFPVVVSEPTNPEPAPTGNCFDSYPNCPAWSCNENPPFMKAACPQSCGWCDAYLDDPTTYCVDTEMFCTGWKEAGHCESNPDYMRGVCPQTCGVCVGSNNSNRRLRGGSK